MAPTYFKMRSSRKSSHSAQLRMAEQRFLKLTERNRRLREQLLFTAVPISEAGAALCSFVQATKDPLLPSVWGAPATDPFVTKDHGCCSTM
ncbi:Guanine nucleotide-binding protein subunit gamma [Tieghemiomyces parasiticus]|uniref:Guanine nucleotide-binding protein subunit gamma n=1 Tax=Tieghemiomyces parasiticus TaxID=78921 RepID=A0A9W7ZFL8_9FUNG|nr:Guanine nucleotide-binding protein subunit gamma [Tieghemiomyces parasiticus]